MLTCLLSSGLLAAQNLENGRANSNWKLVEGEVNPHDSWAGVDRGGKRGSLHQLDLEGPILEMSLEREDFEEPIVVENLDVNNIREKKFHVFLCFMKAHSSTLSLLFAFFKQNQNNLIFWETW